MTKTIPSRKIDSIFFSSKSSSVERGKNTTRRKWWWCTTSSSFYMRVYSSLSLRTKQTEPRKGGVSFPQTSKERTNNSLLYCGVCLLLSAPIPLLLWRKDLSKYISSHETTEISSRFESIFRVVRAESVLASLKSFQINSPPRVSKTSARTYTITRR